MNKRRGARESAATTAQFHEERKRKVRKKRIDLIKHGKCRGGLNL